jgi:hypothetical protein
MLKIDNGESASARLLESDSQERIDAEGAAGGTLSPLSEHRDNPI